MPRRTELSVEAIRHIASGEIGIHAAKKKYGIGESRVLRIRQGLEVAPPDKKDEEDKEAREAVEQAKKARDDALQALAQEKQRIAILESQNEQLRESLAEQPHQEENRPATQQKSKKRKGRKK